MDLNKGFPTLSAYCGEEKNICKFFFNSARIRALKCPLDGIGEGGDFLIFFRGVCGADCLWGIYSISGIKCFL